MPTEMDPNHPKQKFLFFVAQPLDEALRGRVRDLVLRMASLRQWLNGPPRFLNTREEPLDRSKGDLAIETIGGYIEIYSAWAPGRFPDQSTNSTSRKL